MNKEKADPRTVYLIDGSAYIYRAYHAIAPLSTKAGLPTNAVLGFTNILLRVLRDRQAAYVAVAFDAKGKTFRHDMYPEYKAHRPPMPEDLAVQLPYIRRVVDAHNILSLEQNGVEADDLIASATAKLVRSDIPVVVISGDKDLLQLVGPNVRLWDPMNDRWYDRQAVQDKYKVEVEQLLEFFALIGDSSDNIPGIAGVGAKTAEKLINQYGSLEGIYAATEKLGKSKMAERIVAGRQDAFLSRQLISLHSDCPVPERPEQYKLQKPDVEELRELYRELEFTRLLREEVPARMLETAGFALASEQKDLHSFCEQLKGAPFLTIDLETSSLDPLVAEIVGIAVAADADNVHYLPVGHRQANGSLLVGQFDKDMVLQALLPFLTDRKLPKLGHNIKYDYAVLRQAGVTLEGPLWDTMLASYLLDPSRRSHKLDTLSEEFLNRRLTSFEEVTGKSGLDDAFVFVDLEAAKNYSCEDVRATFMLWQLFRPRMEEQGLWPLFSEVEIGLIPVLAEMERTGILVDRDELRRLSADFSRQLQQLENEIYSRAGEAFNINSTRQLGEILFEKLKLPHGRKTKTGYSTDVRVLEKLARYHELPAAIMTHRMLTKLKTTYVDKLQEQIHPVTGRIHTSFNQTVTATGRLSSSDPNLQNIPIRTEEGMRIRRAFVAPKKSVFLAADYSQIDLRVLAHYSEDEALVADFMAGEDIHRRTAAEVFWVSPELVTKEMRRVAKTINFGIVYGMSAFGLASQLDVSRKDAATFIDRYFSHYKGVRRYMNTVVEQARRDGWVSTLLNRRRMLPDISSANKMKREFAERTAINTPIQGTAADIIKLAMLEVEAYLQKQNLGGKMILQIHDELVLEVPTEELEETTAGIREAMESVMELRVPLVVNISSGHTLADV
ncbi:MAG: DNA polymerase I [Deltaproteobacteria bacterium]